jgi:hypothetical protein
MLREFRLPPDLTDEGEKHLASEIEITFGIQPPKRYSLTSLGVL